MIVVVVIVCFSGFFVLEMEYIMLINKVEIV